MKKLFNSRFLFILASSIVVLILLILGAFYLFDDVDDTFVKSGYVLNPLSSTTEKYFFDENVGYRENLSSMIEFVDVDDNEVTILKDSFIHYMDESLSFLKRGAILDLDSLKGSKTVSFYNITSESIIEKKDNGYSIESSNGDIDLKNFIGRISDDKYIVVGDLSLKMAGNSTTIKGDYFEIVYVEEGIVNIENKSVKYQVAADDTLIYVGNDKIVDLGDKKITLNGEDVMSITAITIDGDENIEIIPKAEEDDTDDDGTGDGEGNDNVEPDINTGTEGDGTGGTGNAGVDGEVIKEVTVSLKDATIGSTSVAVTFDVLNATEEDIFKLQVVNLDSGRTVDMVAQVLTDVEIQVNLLTPNTKYLFMVINEKDNNKYFQKVFETTGFGIKLEKTYATESSLAYKVTIEEGTDITNAKLSLYRFNEETMKNEIVTTSYTDSLTGEVITEEKVTYLSTVDGNLEGEHEILYEGLDNNTIYTAVLDEFSVASSNFKDIYNITLTSMTLKKTPIFSEMVVNKDVGEGSFDLSLGNITDPDNAIVSYTYMIYDKFTNELAIEPIVHSNASPLKVLIGDKVNQLKNDTNYYYKAIIEYYDNEKYIEYVTSDSIVFNMGSDPYITVVPNDELINYNQIGATIYLTDNSCLISIPDREKCPGSSTTVVEVAKVNAVTGTLTPVYTKAITFEVNGNEMKYDLLVDGLEPGTTYRVDVRANFNNSDELQREEILHTEESKFLISTRSFTTFTVQWTNVVGKKDMPIIAHTKLIGDENTGTLTPDESAALIDTVVLRLYEGRNIQDIELKMPMAEKTISNVNVNIKENFYDNKYEFNSTDTFGLSAEQLAERSTDGKLNEYYTIVMYVYSDDGQQINLVNNIFSYRVAPGLFNDAETVLELSTITKSQDEELFPNLTNTGTIIGYNIHAYYDRSTMVAGGMIPETINYYVYNRYKEKIKFYVKDDDGSLKLVDYYPADVSKSTENFYELPIYMDYGTDYKINDDVMRRGNSFYIGYEIEVKLSDTETSLYPLATDNNSPTGYGMYKNVTVDKETPSLKMYIASSTADSITYDYLIKDPDNAIYKEADSENYGFYYIVGNGIETKYNMEKSEEEVGFNQFAGRLTLSGMSKGTLYTIYYKKNHFKTGVLENDVADFMEGTPTARMFDGYYDLVNEVNYNFKYQIINNPLKDNKVVIKILADENVLDRILSYKLSFVGRDRNGNIVKYMDTDKNGRQVEKDAILNKELWKLTSCKDAKEGEIARCLSVDYIELAEVGMKSDVGNEISISLDITAIYDNGLSGFDFKVGSNEDSEYPYCILQGNSSELGNGSYVSFSSTGQSITVWSEELDAPKGYYTYKLVTSRNSLSYYSQLGGYSSSFSAILSGLGYSSKHGFVTPKMVSVDEMGCYTTSSGSCNVFSFDTIIPKVDVSLNTSIINGAIMNLKLSGIDIDDIKQEDDSQRYLYIETWDNYADASSDLEFVNVVRPTVKVKINSSNPTENVRAIIDGLKELKGSGDSATGKYYFKVYAYMKSNPNEYIQLFDEDAEGYAVKTYTFESLRAGDLFHSADLNFTSSEEVYGNRSLNTKINLLAYKNSTAYNFDINYILCDINSSVTCDINNEESYIFKKNVPLERISTSFDDSVDISNYYQMEYGKNYQLLIYATSDFYDSENNNELIKRNILINGSQPKDRYKILRKLNEPSFVATRSAILDNGEYGIDFSVVVNDNDRTLIDGEYYVKLLNPNGDIVGNMKLLDDNGDYYDVSNYQDYAFDAFVINKKIRIVGLNPNEKYTFIVYGDAYLNNYNASDTSQKEYTELENGKMINLAKVVEVSKSYSVYSTNNYGVAFGEATYGVTERSIVVTFLGGSNFDNVTEVRYTVGLWDDDTNASTMTGKFVIGENNKYFELYKNSDDWRFVIDPAGMTNVLGKTYKVGISFKVRIPDSDDYIELNPEGAEHYYFEGTVTYYEDEN